MTALLCTQNPKRLHQLKFDMRVRVRWTRNAPKIIYRPSKLLGFVSFGRKIGVWILGAVCNIARLPDHILATSSKQGAIQSQTTSITAAIGNDITQQRGTVFQVHSFILLTSTQRSVVKLTRSSTPPTLVILGRMLSEQCAPYFYWFLTLAHSINFVHSGGKTIYVFGTLIQWGQCNLGS